METLQWATDVLCKMGLFETLEVHFFKVPECVRRTLSRFGAIDGVTAGLDWRTKSHDGGNICYAGTWSFMMLSAPETLHVCQAVKSLKNAGNTMEALFGIAWLHGWMYDFGELERPKRVELLEDEIKKYRAYGVTDQDLTTAVNLVLEFGCYFYALTPCVESAVKAYTGIYNKIAWIQTTNALYNSETQRQHFEALLQGFGSADVFLNQGLPVFPISGWKYLRTHVRRYLEDYADYLVWSNDQDIADWCNVIRTYRSLVAPRLNRTCLCY